MKRIALVLSLLLAVPSLASAQTTDAILDSVQLGAFRFFWNEANPANGLIRDRDEPGSPCSIAAVGFGLTTICIGVDHGWVTRDAAKARVLTTLQTFWTKPQSNAATGTIGYKGLFYHFLDMNTATRSASDVELSTIDTALLFGGILDMKQYFERPDSVETLIRALADSIYQRADWNFTRNFSAGIYMGWKPGTQFAGYGKWTGYNEAMILYLLAIGSPTHPIPGTDWNQWTSTYNFGTQYGYDYLIFEPLFGHQYSHCWIDFRNRDDAYTRARGLTYFENSRRATLAQHAYSVANPLNRVGYGDSLWGITAGDGPTGYTARGAPPSFNDDGTISPTAAIASIAFAPEVVLPFVRNLYHTYQAQLWGAYGPRDGFNLGVGWWGPDVLGIDQGPMAIMIENYRKGSVWFRFMQNPDIQIGLANAGFLSVAGVDTPPRAPAIALEAIAPNPFTGATRIRFRLPDAGPVRLSVYDLAGREVARLLDGVLAAGVHEARFAPHELPGGIYTVALRSAGGVTVKRCAFLR